MERWDRIRSEAVRDKQRLMAKHSGDPLDRIVYRATLFGLDDSATTEAIRDARNAQPRATWEQITAALGEKVEAVRSVREKMTYRLNGRKR